MVGPKLILSIDAGGIRCLIPAMVLAELERRMQATGRMLAMNRYFTMLAGAGVGSLLVSSLAYPHTEEPGAESQADDILKGFAKAASMFPNRIMTSSGEMRLDTNLFEAFLKNRHGERTLVSEATNHVLLPAFDLGSRVPLMITNTDPITSKFYLWQALRGVVAVLPDMSPALVENRAAARPRGTPLIPVVSGGRYAEDPALAAYVEARKLGWHERGFTILSLGAGNDLPHLPFINPMNNSGLDMTDVTGPLLRSADQLHCPIANHVNLLMNGETRAFNGVSTRLTSENRHRLHYFRINSRLEEDNHSKTNFEPGNVEQLKAEAMRMIEEHSSILDEVVNRMPTDEQLIGTERRPARAAALSVPTHRRTSEPTARPPEPQALLADFI